MAKSKSGAGPLVPGETEADGIPTSGHGAGRLAVVYRPTAELIPYARNSRTHDEIQVGQIAASIREFGWTNPILIDDEGTLIAGHGRLLAAQLLKLESVPTIRLEGLSKTQRRALIIADNKLAMNAGWDTELLKLELADLSADGFELSLLGFDDEELADLSDPDEDEGGDGEGEASEGGAGSLGDRFLIAPFTVLNAREGWWQDRKRTWLALGIQSEVGRGENLLRMSDTMLEPDPVKRAAMQDARAKADAGGAQMAGALNANDTYRDPQFYAKKRKLEGELGRKLSIEEFRQIQATCE